MKRYEKTGYNYPGYYLVECPDCKREGRVERQSGFATAIFTCSNCMSKKVLSDNVRYRVYVKRNCPDCGNPTFAEQSGLKIPVENLKVTCPHCCLTLEYQPNVEKYWISNDSCGLKGDPRFNFPLWLQTEVRGNLFWAYNREHLNEIRVYVEADLRERQTGYAKGMVAWLPQFIKDAKNRADILKAIDRMLKR